MKYLKLFESFEDIHEICKKYNIKNYTINSDGSIDVDGDVNLSDRHLKKLPLKFNKVNRYFFCGFNKLTSLEGSPVEVNSNFYCYNNELTSFKYAPKIIRGHFDCACNKINSFEYFPIHVGGKFYCNSNNSLSITPDHNTNPIWYVWNLFRDTTKIELLNDCDIFRDEDSDNPGIILDRLNDFLLTIGKRKKRGYSYNKAIEILPSYRIL